MVSLMPGQPAEREDESPLAPELVREIRAAQARLEGAVLEAKLHDDPMRFPLIALSDMLGVLHRLFVDGTLTLSRAIEDARRPISKEELTTLERAATRGFAGQAVAFVRAQNLRTALIAGGVLFGVAILAGGGGYWWGRSAARADIRQTETGLATAFANGPEAAREWWSLMAWNDPRKALANCKVRVDGGRRACDLPMWIEGPQAPGQGR